MTDVRPKTHDDLPDTAPIWPPSPPRQPWLHALLNRVPPEWRTVPVAILAGLVVVLSISLAVSLATRPSGSNTPSQAEAGDEARTPLELAVDDCNNRASGYAGEISDNGTTLYFDMRGEETGSGRGVLDALACVLSALDTPERIIRDMEDTRALDGRQEAEWANFTASWRYHPDDGLDVLITMQSP